MIPISIGWSALRQRRVRRLARWPRGRWLCAPPPSSSRSIRSRPATTEGCAANVACGSTSPVIRTDDGSARLSHAPGIKTGEPPAEEAEPSVPPVSARRISSVHPFDKSWRNLIAHDHDAQDAIVTEERCGSEPRRFDRRIARPCGGKATRRSAPHRGNQPEHAQHSAGLVIFDR